MNGLVTYFREALEELRRVNWPSRDEVIQSTETTLIFVVGFTLILFVADAVFNFLARNGLGI